MKNLQLLVILFVLGFLAGCKNHSGEAVPSEPAAHPSAGNRPAQPGLLHIEAEMLRDLKVTTAAVEERPGGEDVGLLGELHVNEDNYAEVGSPVSARIVAVHAVAGQSVTAGQPLVTLQSTDLGRARAQLASAKAKLALAEQALARKRSLAEEKIVSQREVQEAEASASSAEAELQAAQAELRALGVSAGPQDDAEGPQFTLSSPLRGVVLERVAVLGQTADPQRALLRIGNLSTLWLTVQAFERDAVRLKAGLPARIAFPALPGRTFTGKVAVVGQQVDLQSRTIPVRIDVSNPQDLLRPGMSANAWITPGAQAAKLLAIPAASMQRLGEEWVVFLPRARDTFEIRRVGRGRDLAGEIEVLSGLTAGETVVVDGAFLLKAEADKARGEGEEHDH
jgi:cobalt-zinc-cadmium efflux system membrane fusion protein